MDRLNLFAVDLSRIEQPVRVDERQARGATDCVDLAVEARLPSGVTGSSRLLDANPDRVLIAVQPHLDHPLGVPGAFALAPQRVAGPAEVPRLAAFDRLAQGLVVHVRDHQHVAGRSVGRHAGDQAGRVEFRLEFQPFLAVVRMCGCGHG